MRYVVVGSGSPQTISVSRGDASHTIISELRPSRTYSIQVAARNRADIGPYSRRFNQLTTGIYSVCTEYVTHSVVVHLQLLLQFCQMAPQQPPPSPSPGVVLA